MAIDRGDTPCSLAVMGKAPVVTADLANDSRWEGSPWLPVMKSAGFGSCLAMPIASASGEASGVVANYRGPGAPGAHEEELIDRLTKIAGIAIDRAEASAVLQSRERELREALARLSEGQRLTKTGSFFWATDTEVWEASDEFRRIFAIEENAPVTVDRLLGRVHPDDLPLATGQLEAAFQGHPIDFVCRLTMPDGSLKYLRSFNRGVTIQNGRSVLTGSVLDVTDSKLAEEALNRARGELAHVARVATLNAMTASIAHEVSQPLSGILTNANTCVRMLAADPPNLEGAVETVRRTIRDANRAAEVIGRLRAMFSKNAPRIERVGVNDVAREVIALSTAELRQSGALVQTDFADDLPPVAVDRVQLQQVILNLLLNAADAMVAVEDRPRTLLVQTSLHDRGDVQLTVRDSGIGLTPEAIEKLFDAFYTTKAHGMGVGLSISRSIIEGHNGRLWAAANDGPGATFSFCIPSAASTESTDGA